MFNLCYVLQFVIDCFYQGAFSEKQTGKDRHQSLFHIAFEFGNELYAVHKSRSKSEWLIYPLSPINWTYDFDDWFIFQWMDVI